MLEHITDSTGTILNRYTLEKEDGSQETIKLTFNPSDDYEQGTPFNEDNINPIIDEVNALETQVNALETQVGSYKLWVGTQTQYDAISSKDANTIYHILES